MKIYTKTGDAGQTSLYGGQRLMKSDLRIEAYGTVDELNAHLGMVRDQEINESLKDVLLQIQHVLFNIGSHLAATPGNTKLKLPSLQQEDVETLEIEIDKMDEIIAPLTHFILPGGHTEISACHIARCVCRRAERRIIELHQLSPVEPLILQFINRLSDFLFVFARYKAHILEVKEIRWIPKA